jgi:hypothetical protein
MRVKNVGGVGALILTSVLGCAVFKGSDPPPFYSCVAVGCPLETCTVTYPGVAMSALEACFGWDEATQTWTGDAPDAVKRCRADVATCDLTVDHYVEADLTCAYNDPVNDPISMNDCNYTEPPATDDDLEGQLADCQIAIPKPSQICTPNAGAVVVAGDCDTCDDAAAQARMAPPPAGATTLTVDRARSLIGFTTAVQSVSVPVSGTMVADLSSGRLLSVRLVTDRTRLAGSDWDGWTFALEKPVQLQRADDAFTIAVAQHMTIVGTGRRDGARAKLRAAATRDVAGHLRPGQHSFDADFADQSATGSITLHLAGTM